MKIWPAPGRRVRDPVTGQLLTLRGVEVPDTSFWRRRLADGDVLTAPPTAQSKPPKPPKPPKPATRKDPA